MTRRTSSLVELDYPRLRDRGGGSDSRAAAAAAPIIIRVLNAWVTVSESGPAPGPIFTVTVPRLSPLAVTVPPRPPRRRNVT